MRGWLPHDPWSSRAAVYSGSRRSSGYSKRRQRPLGATNGEAAVRARPGSGGALWSGGQSSTAASQRKAASSRAQGDGRDVIALPRSVTSVGSACERGAGSATVDLDDARVVVRRAGEPAARRGRVGGGNWHHVDEQPAGVRGPALVIAPGGAARRRSARRGRCREAQSSLGYAEAVEVRQLAAGLAAVSVSTPWKQRRRAIASACGLSRTKRSSVSISVRRRWPIARSAGRYSTKVASESGFRRSAASRARDSWDRVQLTLRTGEAQLAAQEELRQSVADAHLDLVRVLDGAHEVAEALRPDGRHVRRALLAGRGQGHQPLGVAAAGLTRSVGRLGICPATPHPSR